ncbi:MAG: hypothetical protein AAFV59_04315 [Pseudomonadota bacterium]
MLAILAAIQSFTVALLLAWMGFSLDSDTDSQKESSAPAPSSSFSSFITG